MDKRPAHCTHATFKLPIVQSTEAAWTFVKSVTGYGFAPATSESTTKEEETQAVSRDPLDYTRFEKLVKEVDAEEKQPEPPEARLLRSLQAQTRDNDPKAALDILTGNYQETSAEAQSDDAKDDQDTSSYFLSRDNVAAFSGCAHDRSKERALYNRPTEEKLKMARRFRLEGNIAFEGRDFQCASVNYQKALLYYDYTFPEGDLQEEQFNRDKLSAHLNLAAAKLNLQEYRECISQCYQATKMDSNCLKAYYRKAQAHLALDEFDQVDEILEGVKKLAGCDGKLACSFIKLQLQCRQKRIINRKKAPQVYKKMFADSEDSSKSGENEELQCGDGVNSPKVELKPEVTSSSVSLGAVVETTADEKSDSSNRVASSCEAEHVEVSHLVSTSDSNVCSHLSVSRDNTLGNESHKSDHADKKLLGNDEVKINGNEKKPDVVVSLNTRVTTNSEADMAVGNTALRSKSVPQPRHFDLHTDEEGVDLQCPLLAKEVITHPSSQSGGWWYDLSHDDPGSEMSPFNIRSLPRASKNLVGVAFIMGAVATASMLSFVMRYHAQGNTLRVVSIVSTPAAALVSSTLAYLFVRLA